MVCVPYGYCEGGTFLRPFQCIMWTLQAKSFVLHQPHDGIFKGCEIADSLKGCQHTRLVSCWANRVVQAAMQKSMLMARTENWR